ncbi:uncharacterized protein LOC110885587 [Helianthus annuus]|uniref:uncharacterized protein LOC110885587 n=1 Tax=Helianthus annuus TaxID=4232 RepID=UPI001652BCDC|nr:uncharacterized protein LOC110885587 [Helianthus annuus]
MKQKSTSEIDVDYNPDDTGDDSEEDYQEVARTVGQVSKKVHRAQYIPPMSMKKIANLAKLHRVNAPNVSQKVPSGSNTTRSNHQRATVTMGQLISSNKGGANRSMALVDEDDYEDDEIIQEVNKRDMELDGVSDDENELEIQDGVDQDDQCEDMDDMIHANNQNEKQMNDNDDLEINNDVQEQSRAFELGKASGHLVTSKSKSRGPTMLHVVHMQSIHERKVIKCNKYGQPIGPETAEKDVAGEFSRFLGTIARNYDYAPLTYASWHKVPNKDRIWQYVLEKYDVPEAAKTWVLMTIGSAYKRHKCRFKKKPFYQYKDNKTRWKNKPKNIKDEDFSKLMTLWNNKDEAKRCLRAKEARMSQKNMHIAGPKSFARIRNEMSLKFIYAIINTGK